MQESVVQRRCDGVQVVMTWRSRSSPKVETGGVGPARGHGHAYEAVLRFALARRILRQNSLARAHEREEFYNGIIEQFGRRAPSAQCAVRAGLLAAWRGRCGWGGRGKLMVGGAREGRAINK